MKIEAIFGVDDESIGDVNVDKYISFIENRLYDELINRYPDAKIIVHGSNDPVQAYHGISFVVDGTEDELQVETEINSDPWLEMNTFWDEYCGQL